MRKLFIILLILVTLFTFGCVQKTESFYQHPSELEDVKLADTNGDNIPDQWMFEFKPYVNPIGVEFRRTVLVEGVNVNSSFTPEYTYVFSQGAKDLYIQSLQHVVNYSYKCSYGIDEIFPCSDESECYAKCNARIRCKNALSKYPTLKGKFYLTDSLLSEVISESSELLQDINLHSNYTSVDYKSLLAKRDKLSSDLQRLINLPLFSNFICDSNSFLNLYNMLVKLETAFDSVSDINGSYYFNAFSSYRITNRLSIVYNDDGIIYLGETLPPGMVSTPSQVEFKTPYESLSPNLPVVSKFKLTFRKGSVESNDIVYMVQSAPAINWYDIIKVYNYPYGDLQVVDLKSLAIVQSFINFYENTYFNLSKAIGTRYSLAITIFIILFTLYIIVLLFKLVLYFFDTLSRREPLIEIMYKLAGQSSGNRVELIALILIASAGGWYLSNQVGAPPLKESINYLLNNPSLLGGVALFNIGLFAFYFLVSDILKGLLLGSRYYMNKASDSVHKLLLEKDMKEELTNMRNDILSLHEFLSEQGFPIKENIDGFINSLSKAENLLSRGKIDSVAKLLGSSLRTEYLNLRGRLMSYKNRLDSVSKLLSEFHDEYAQYEDLRVKAKQFKVKYVQREWLMEAEKYKEYITKGDYDRAASYLEQILSDLKKQVISLKDSVNEHEHLLSNKFPCPVCGQLTSLAYDSCVHCGVPLKEGFETRLKTIKDELYSLHYKLERYNSRDLNRMYESINVLVNHLEEYITDKKYDKASHLTLTIEERVHHVKDVLARYSNDENELESLVDDIDKMFAEIPKLITKGLGAGLDMSSFESSFKSLQSKYQDLQVSEKSLYEILVQSREIHESLSYIYNDLRKYITKFQDSVNIIEEINNRFIALSTLITKARGIGIDVNGYEKRLSLINLDSIADRVESNNMAKEELHSIVSELADMETELSKKVRIGEQISRQIDSVKSHLSAVNALLDECSSKGLMPYEESSYILSVDLDYYLAELKYLRLDSAEKLLGDLYALNRRLSEVQSRLKQKLHVLDLWPEWKSYISSLLRHQNKVGPDNIIEIPPEWRSWAIDRFVRESNLPITLEKGVIVKLKDVSHVNKDDLDNILMSMVSSGKIRGVSIIRRDGLVISSNLPDEVNSAQVGALSASAMRSADKAFGAVDKGKANYVIINASDGKFVISSAGDQALISVIVDKDEDLGYVYLALKNAALKIRNILDKL